MNNDTASFQQRMRHSSDSGGLAPGEMSIFAIDQVWVDFAEQLKLVRDGKVKIAALEAQLEREMEANELMADSYERLLVEYQTLLKQQKSF